MRLIGTAIVAFSASVIATHPDCPVISASTVTSYITIAGNCSFTSCISSNTGVSVKTRRTRSHSHVYDQTSPILISTATGSSKSLTTKTRKSHHYPAQSSTGSSPATAAGSSTVSPGHTKGHHTKPTTLATSSASSVPVAPIDCQADNCLRALLHSPTSAEAFCATYTKKIHTKTAHLPEFVGNCEAKTDRISSACTCFTTTPAEATSSVSSKSRHGHHHITTSATCSAVVFETYTPTSTYTTTITLSSSTQSSSSIETVSSDASSMSSLISSTVSSTTQEVKAAPTDCQPDNCYRAMLRSDISISALEFCATYTTTTNTVTTDLPAYIVNCEGQTSAISSACSCAIYNAATAPATVAPATTSAALSSSSSLGLSSAATSSVSAGRGHHHGH